MTPSFKRVVSMALLIGGITDIYPSSEEPQYSACSPTCLATSSLIISMAILLKLCGMPGIRAGGDFWNRERYSEQERQEFGGLESIHFLLVELGFYYVRLFRVRLRYTRWTIAWLMSGNMANRIGSLKEG